jgi:hypothetical protein
MPVFKMTFQVEGQDLLAAIAKLKNEPDVLKYIVSVFQVKEDQQTNGWGEAFKSQVFGTKK